MNSPLTLTDRQQGEDPRFRLKAPPKLADTELGECMQDLIVAVFRMAVCDYFCEPYYLGEPREDDEVVEMRRVDAARFLASQHAEDLARTIGLSAGALQRGLFRSRRAARANARREDSWDL